jgi:hypothetical protein
MTVDPVTGQHLLNACWLAASLGSATLQLRLFAQALPSLDGIGAGRFLGTGVAVLALVWLLGTRLGHALARYGSAPGWGAWLLASTLTWLLVPALGLAPQATLAPDLLHLTACGTLAFLLALFGSAWLAHQRPWPAAGEGTSQVAGLCAVLFGLVLTWTLPAWSGAVGCALLLPLVLLDLCPRAFCPLPDPRQERLPVLSRPGGTRGAARVQSRHRDGPPPARTGLWWWTWLARRGQLAQTLLGGVVLLTCASVWSVVPTLYALALARAGALFVLLWLAGGQLAACLLGAALVPTRGGRRLLLVGAVRMGPRTRQVAFALSWSALGLAALGLAALGNPWQQAPWFLGLALFGYTLGVGAWSRLHGRLLPLLAPDAGYEPRFVPWAVPQSTGTDDLVAQRRKLDEQGRLCVARWEETLLLVAVLLTGLLCDAWGIDPMLILAGCTITAGLGLSLIAASGGERPSAQVDEDVLESRRALVGVPVAGSRPPAARAEPWHTASDTPSTGGERETTAQHRLFFPSPTGERPGRHPVQEYAPLPLNSEEGGERRGLGDNGNATY